jgi:quercetin 2,3-dioxygenase
MMELRPFSTLGRFQNGWLDAHYHFSFSGYRDASRMGLGKLRVWNDDRIAAQNGFDPHPHRDMEIITYVRRGAISHRDSLGNQGRTGAGDVQVMSAGTGIVHAEYNLEAEPTDLFQIWIETAARGVPPAWAARQFPQATRRGRFELLVSGDGVGEDVLRIHQDAAVLGATLAPGETANWEIRAGRYGYLVPARGRITVNGIEAAARDGLAVIGPENLAVTAIEEGEIVLVDVP